MCRQVASIAGMVWLRLKHLPVTGIEGYSQAKSVLFAREGVTHITATLSLIPRRALELSTNESFREKFFVQGCGW
jgi:hypothetical protein